MSRMRKRYVSLSAPVLLILVAPLLHLSQLALGQPADLSNRADLASELASVFSNLNAQLPQLSLSQRAWLKREYDDQIASAGGRYTTRALTASQSIEYQLRIAKPHVRRLNDALQMLVTDAGSPSATDQEVAYWTFVAYLLMDKTFWQSIEHLVERGIVRPRIGHVDHLYYENYVLEAQTILAQIVIPHLQGKPPK